MDNAIENCFCQIDECVLCEAQLYDGLTPQQVCEIRGLLIHRDYPARTTLFREGESSGYLYLLRTGQLKLTNLSANGREQIIGIGLPGHLLGFHTMDDTAHSYTAEALTPVSVCTISRVDMEEVLRENPAVARRVIDIINEELVRARGLVRLLGRKTSVEKVAAFVLSLSPLGFRNGTPTELPLPLSRQEMADLLGLTVETVSRHMSEFKRAGIVDAPRGHVTILDADRLAALAGELPLGRAFDN